MKTYGAVNYDKRFRYRLTFINTNNSALSATLRFRFSCIESTWVGWRDQINFVFQLLGSATFL